VYANAGMYRYSDVSSTVSAMCYSMTAGMTMRGVPATTAFVSTSTAFVSAATAAVRFCKQEIGRKHSRSSTDRLRVGRNSIGHVITNDREHHRDRE
jgi:hypothetical protein